MKRLWIFMFSTLAALTLAGCRPSYEWNQKLTVVVETPNGERSGSAVTQVTARIGEGSVMLTNAAYKVEGEATVVDLGHRKYLFALLANSGANATEYWALNNFRPMVMDNYPNTTDDLNKFYTALENLRDTQTLTPDHYPLLVTFGDLADPKSVKEVKPGDLQAMFGAGYRLKMMTLEITEEAVTLGKIDTLLGWLGKFPELPLCEPKSGMDFSFCATRVHHGDFAR